MTPGIKPLIAGNWKMNGLNAQLPELKAIREGFDAAHSGTDGCPSLCAVHVDRQRRRTWCRRSARRHWRRAGLPLQCSGAHTGDISAEMIADCGAGAVIVGHSERRTDHGETSATVRAKAEAALRAGLLPIVCIGETRAQREAGETLAVSRSAQLEASLPGSAVRHRRCL